MTELRADLRRLAEAATPGPWTAQPSEHEPPKGIVYGPDGDSFAAIEWNPGNDYDPVATAAYITALSPDRVLALLDRLAALEAGSLDEAWARCEAALPDGWVFTGISTMFNDRWHVFALGPKPEGDGKCPCCGQQRHDQRPGVSLIGDTPVLALTALAEALEARAALVGTPKP